MKIKDFFDNFKSVVNKKRTLKATGILNNGVIATYITGSVISGVIDLVFFSGLSVALYSIFGAISIPAGLVLCLMSLVITAAKAWSAMKTEQINELISVLKSLKYKCWTQLKKPKFFWKFIHRTCMAVSVITAMSLSVVSIGDGIRRNQEEIKKINKEIATLSELINANSIGQSKQREIIYSSVSIGQNSTAQAEEQASKIWDIIVDYRNERAEFEALGVSFSSQNEIEWHGEKIVPNDYWDKKNSEVENKIAVYRKMSLQQIKTVVDKNALTLQIKNEIENLNKNNSKDELLLLDQQTKDELVIAVRNLQNRFHRPVSQGGAIVEFDENNPSMALTILKDLRAAYENDTGDVGGSAKLFVLAGPAVEEKFSTRVTLENISDTFSVSSFGAAEIMIMVAILFFGLLQEIIIAAFTPKVTITRNVFFYYNLDEDIDIENVMYYINRNYLSYGVIDLEEFEKKNEESKIIRQVPSFFEDTPKKIKKEPTAKKEKALKSEKQFSSKVDSAIKEVEELLND